MRPRPPKRASVAPAVPSTVRPAGRRAGGPCRGGGRSGAAGSSTAVENARRSGGADVPAGDRDFLRKFGEGHWAPRSARMRAPQQLLLLRGGAPPACEPRRCFCLGRGGAARRAWLRGGLVVVPQSVSPRRSTPVVRGPPPTRPSRGARGKAGRWSVLIKTRRVPEGCSALPASGLRRP